MRKHEESGVNLVRSSVVYCPLSASDSVINNGRLTWSLKCGKVPLSASSLNRRMRTEVGNVLFLQGLKS